ncbi:hypothetical protein [Acinetobacter soli]|uniref:hypothetical protein n=1 Tax=Acinetobacter soli TaxID=487316 RepID=UPI000CE473D2|nr:hypothetical protein [Acinetobacter soli]PPB87771.1 hypothetical protein AsoHEU7_03560 [Acinetobacter soli]
MKISELLKKPEFNEKIESMIAGHILSAYQKANREPPIPRWIENTFVYADPSPAKYAARLREGVVLLAGVLDSFQESDKAEGDNNG